MTSAGVHIHAVVETAIHTKGLWTRMPPGSWPSFVRLWKSTPADEVALFVGVLSSYGRGRSSASSPAELLEDFPCILPGGLAVVSPDREILPSCCCGLEMWNEWRNVVTTGESPWTGHDPAPLVELVGDQVRVWSDGAMGGRPSETEPLVLDRAEFNLELERVQVDLGEFLQPLRAWLDVEAPAHADAIVQRFAEGFVRR